MPTYDYVCETCGHHGRAWRTEENGVPRFCSRKCRNKSDTPTLKTKREKYIVTPEMHNAIRAACQKNTGNGEIRDLAARLGLPRWKITRHAIVNGWTPKQKKEPDWSEREINILGQNAHRTPEVIQRRLKKYGFRRTLCGIVIKRKRMRFLQNLSGHSARSVAECLGVNDHVVLRYINTGQLKARRRGTARTKANGGDHYYIKDRDIKNFLMENTAIIDFRKIDKYWLVDILTGVSP